MRLDHVAYRTADRHKASQFFQDAFGYKIQDEFVIDFGDGEIAQCIALEPPEKLKGYTPFTWSLLGTGEHEFHLAPEIFVSDGTESSIVGKWIAKRGGVGGIHHLAYQVKSVEDTIKLWKENGWGEFSSEEPIRCPGLIQIFTKPHPLTGVIYEFIEREGQGFCKDNVKNLMISTKDL